VIAGGSSRSRAETSGPWVSVAGDLPASELERAAAGLGIALDARRRREWAQAGLFPLPARAGYHRLAPLLAAFVQRTVGAEPARADPERLRRALATIQLLRERAGEDHGSAAGEDRFYGFLQTILGDLVAPPLRPPADDEAPPRWTTRSGTLTASALEAACAERGVVLDRARRTYWQAERVFPQPERRPLRPPEARGGARGYYHAGAVDLACVVDYAVRGDHPSKPQPWRCTVRELGALMAGWRRQGDGDEDAFYARIAAMLPLIGSGDPLPGVAPPHRDVLPSDQHRLDEDERAPALRATARVAEAIADDWVAEHTAEPPPTRLVVWFRMERTGPDHWKIADAGARPTSHGRLRARPGGA
jgi:hypothetical protein